MNTLTLETFFDLLIKIIDIAIVWGLMFYVLKIVRNNSRTVQIFKGIIFVFLANIISKAFGLTTVAWLAGQFIGWGVIVVIIIFQPEIRGILEKIGKSSVFSSVNILTGHARAHLVDQLVSATSQLSKTKTGALISLEQGQSLSDYINTGTPMNSTVTAELLVALFVTTTPLHDGAVIIKGDRIACASAYFPPTHIELPPKYGARHRAAIGISEITDSVTIVVSEETGTISIAQEGKLTTMDEASLRDFLMQVIGQNEREVSRSVTAKGAAAKRSWFPSEKKNIIELDEDEKKLLTKEKPEKDKPKTASESEPKGSRIKHIFGIFNTKKKEMPAEEPKSYASKMESKAKNESDDLAAEPPKDHTAGSQNPAAEKPTVKVENVDGPDLDSLLDQEEAPKKRVRTTRQQDSEVNNKKDDVSEGDDHE